ncbi:MAG: 23S rRNA pseudouridine(1911/1915/1917) synthase RluD [Saccharospirillaceae bacterium]|nr:23S rRNA pseudouridine(1911/1915/1917) synthase RluD [Pseudomonadales bacterium]NRB78624.1 23S rRNA pseudouridine(1911/1915/1917) synthase RluD [Saccharospirillaceae bacterium]
MSEPLNLERTVTAEFSHQRVDHIAVQLFPEYSRSKLQNWIVSGELTVDGKIRKCKEKLPGGEVIRIQATLEVLQDHQPQDMPIDVIYKDDTIIVINKPMGLVVHPGAGKKDGTLLNALLFHFPELSQVPRAGIVHRLDKDTTGLMVVARTLMAHGHLIEQLQTREMGREYEAVVIGQLTGGGMVNEPIARHSTQRIKMAVQPMGKEAITHYRLLKKYDHHSHIRLKLETGRTHQIRVHMAYLHYPLVGDSTYAGRLRLPKGISEELQYELKNFPRQALHAQQLELIHPKTGEQMCFNSDLPEDFVDLLSALEFEFNSHERF